MMLFDVMKNCHNFFPTGICKNGKYTIENGTVSLDFVSDGNYIMIEGSISNDGVYQYPVTDLTDETFNGTISVLAPPKAFLSIVEEIEAWKTANGDRSAFQSESFGGYSYTRATNAGGSAVDWPDVFKQRLSAWRKL